MKQINNSMVEVEWIDAESFVGGSYWRPSEITDKEMGSDGDTVKSIGYEMKNDENGVLLAQSSPKFEGGSCRDLGGCFFIPKGCVKKIRRLMRCSL